MNSLKNQQTLLARLLMCAETEKDMEKLLGEVFSPAEIDRAAQRIHTARALLKRETYRSIEKRLGSSTYVIYRSKRNIVNSKSGLVCKILKSLGELD